MSDNTVEFDAAAMPLGVWKNCTNCDGYLMIDLPKDAAEGRYRVTLTRIEPEREATYGGKPLSKLTREELENAVLNYKDDASINAKSGQFIADRIAELQAELAKRPEPLKPCPHYGHHTDVQVVDRKVTNVPYYVICLHCGAQTGNYATREQAIAAWNRRA